MVGVANGFELQFQAANDNEPSCIVIMIMLIIITIVIIISGLLQIGIMDRIIQLKLRDQTSCGTCVCVVWPL